METLEYRLTGDGAVKATSLLSRKLRTLRSPRQLETPALFDGAISRYVEQAGSSQAWAHYLAHLNHAIRSPLAALRAINERLVRDFSGDVRVSKRLDRFSEQVKYFSDLLNRQLVEAEFAARRDDDIGSRLRPVSLGTIVRRVARILHHLATSKDIGLEIRHGTSVTVRADPRLISIAISNLVENAVKYSFPRSTVSISIGSNREGRGYVRIENRGVGIDSKQASQIFERGFRGRVAQEVAAGAGMGLWISREILRLHAGDAYLVRPAEPTIFELVLPVYDEK